MKRNRLGTALRSYDVFSIGVLLAVLLCWFFHIITRSAYIDTYFVTDHDDTAMDYFHMLANLNHRDPWYNNANYPALVFLFFKVMHRMLPVADMGDGFYLRTNMIAQLGYILFVAVCLIIIWETIRYMTKDRGWSGILFAAAIVFSGPMIFLLERGNVLLAVLVFSLLFLAFYDDDRKALRIVAYVSLSIAAAIKIYPAVLGLLVLSKKRYKETILLMIIGATFFLAPFFVFDGIESLKKMIEGISQATAVQTSGTGFGCNFSMNNLVQIVGAVFGKYIVSVPGWVSVVSAIFCLILFLLCKQEWQKLYALVMLCIWFPGFSYTYTLVLLFLPIISYFYRTEPHQRGRFKLIYPFAFILLIIPYALPMVERINGVMQLNYVKFPVSWGMVIINFVLVLLAGMIMIEAILDRKNKKNIGDKAQ